MTDVGDMTMRNPDCIYNQIEDVIMHAWKAGFRHGYGDGTQPSFGSYPTGKQVQKVRQAVAADIWKRFDRDFVQGDRVDEIYRNFLTEIIGPRPDTEEAGDESNG